METMLSLNINTWVIKMNSVLPVGSVITIKDKSDKYIIIGKNIETPDNKYDYCCVVYPYGFLIDKQSLYYFNDTDVKELVINGNINY